MNLKKKSNIFPYLKLGFLIALTTLSLNSWQTALAETTSNNKGPINPPKPQKVVITPESLRVLLLQQNIALKIQMNLVYQAKESINLNRTKLLPSINLGSLFSTGPSFALNTVSTLLPFLIPSNWLNLSQSQHLLNAQTASYYITQLNVYSSAYSIYLTIIDDLELRDVLNKQYENYKFIESIISQAVDAGMMNQDQLLQAHAQTQIYGIQVSQIDTLILQEKAAVRNMLNLPLSAEIVFEKIHIAPSSAETLPLQTLLDRALAKAPELKQLDSLVSAAKVAEWTAAFGFITGASLSATHNSNGSFDTVSQIGTINLGFTYFPLVKLADYNIDEIRLQKKQAQIDEAQLIETTIGSLKAAQKQFDLATDAEKNLQLFYDGEVEKFRAGMTDLLHVLNAGTSLTLALTNKVKSQINIDALRVSLNRALIEDQFSRVRPCEIKRQADGSFLGSLGRALGQTSGDISLDQTCGPLVKN